jgi:hypothetical protein
MILYSLYSPYQKWFESESVPCKNIPARGWEFFTYHRVQNVSGTHQISYPVGTRGSFPGCKAAGVWS